MIDEDLAASLELAIGGDERGFSGVYRAVQPGLLRYLRVAIGREAEDVAADVWLEVARDVRGFSGDAGKFRAWVFTIGRQRAIDHGRRQARRPASLVPEVPDSAGGDDTANAALDSLHTEAALAFVRRLPKDQAEAVMLRVVVGFDVAETARILGKRPGAVRVNTMRGLRTLTKLLPPVATERDQGVTPSGR
ncbi:MAG TPA: sigma-70 family RNA polymerase sigma factor [Mycobacteriales bacterium]|nr:sigma-70 family RNA polymerase sigma factor [Mycobacteriales bacterium]